MDNNLTINSKAFTWRYSDPTTGSLRECIAAGLNIPEKMRVLHQDYTDSKTNRPARRDTLIFTRAKALADGSIAPEAVRLTMKVEYLVDANIVDTDINTIGENLVGTIQEDDSGLNLMTNIFVNREQ